MRTMKECERKMEEIKKIETDVDDLKIYLGWIEALE